MMGLGKGLTPFKHDNLGYQFVRFLGCRPLKFNSEFTPEKEGRLTQKEAGSSSTWNPKQPFFNGCLVKQPFLQ